MAIFLHGLLFDVTATNGLTIKCFEANLYAGTIANYEIYYRAGTHVGNENNPGAWTLLGGATGILSAGNNLPTPLPITVNVSIPTGQTYAFYVTNSNGAGGTSYTDGTSVGKFLASDANLTVYEGVGKSYPFGILTINVRNFNGHIFYDLLGADAGPDPIDAALNILSLDLSNCGSGSNLIQASIEVTNLSSGDSIYSSMPIALYNGNPFTSSAVLMTSVFVTKTLGYGQSDTISVAIPDQGGSFTFYAVANIDGTETTPLTDTLHVHSEENLMNNFDSIVIISCEIDADGDGYTTGNGDCDDNNPLFFPGSSPAITAGTATNPSTCSGTNGSIHFTSTNLADGSYSLVYTGTGSPKSVTVANDTFRLSALPDGMYSAFSITINGCTGSDAASKTLTDPVTPTITAGTATNPSTCSGTDGSIHFTSTNLPNGNYSLTFTGAGSPKSVTVANDTFRLSALPDGMYSAFSITLNECTGSDASSKTLADPATPTITAGTTTDPSTCSGMDGSIHFTSTNLPDGNYSLTYTGTGSPKSVTVTNDTFRLSALPDGMYSAFSITLNGCTGSDASSKSLTDPATPTIAAGTATNPSTCSGSDGSIHFTSTNLPNGNYSMTYTGTGSPKSVTVANDTFRLNALPDGMYSAFSITLNGCTGSDASSKSLTDPAAPTISAGAATNPSTCSGTDGSIHFTTTNLPDGNYSLTFTGTGSPKSVTVTNDTFRLNALQDGMYSAFSIKLNGCTGSDASSKSLTDPATPTIAAGTATNPSTCSGSDGSIHFTSSNLPDGNYSLTFTGTGSPKSVTVTNDTFRLNALQDGMYSAFSITLNGCTGSDASSKSLTDPAAPTISAGAATNPSTCSGTDGSIHFTTTNLPNGNYSLTYTGTGSPKSITVTNDTFRFNALQDGMYSAFSITLNGCTGSDASSKTLTDPATPTISAGTATNPSTCSGTNGSIHFTSSNLSDGNYSLTYTGTGSPKSVTVTNDTFRLNALPDGMYSAFSITVNGCTGSDASSKTLTDPATPTITAGTATNPSTCSGTDGSIHFTTTNLPNGNYSLTYTGAGSPKSVTVTNDTFRLNALQDGMYSAFSITLNGCTGSDASSKSLTDPDTPTISAGTATNPSTCSGTDGSIHFTSSNLPDGNYSFTYTGTGSPKSVTVTNDTFRLNALPDGMYSAFSITLNGCTGSDASSKSLADPGAPTITAGTAINPSTCSGTDGSIHFTSSNLPDGNYSLNYTGTGSPKSVTVTNDTFRLNALPNGMYSAFSITLNGCTGSDASSKSLTDPATPTITAGTATNPSTCSGTDGSIHFTSTNLPDGNYSLNYTGTGSPKSVTITNDTFRLSALPDGMYSAFSITLNGCTGMDASTQEMNDPSSHSITTGTVTSPLNCGGTGNIDFSTSNVPNGTYTLHYKKDGADSTRAISIMSDAFELNSIYSGTYRDFSITHFGCTDNDTTSRTITDPAPKTASAGMDQVSCQDSVFSLSANGIGQWSVVSGPGILTSATDSSTFIYGVNPDSITILTWQLGTGNCIDYDSIIVSNSSIPNASFSYDTSDYYESSHHPIPIITGSSGGIFRSDDSLQIDSLTGRIDLNLSKVGTHIITYQFTGMCPTSSSVTILINKDPAQSRDVEIRGPKVICANLTHIPYSLSKQHTYADSIHWIYSGTEGSLKANRVTASLVLPPSAGPGILSVHLFNSGFLIGEDSISLSLSSEALCALASCTREVTYIDNDIILKTNALDVYKASSQIQSDANIPTQRDIVFLAGQSIELYPSFSVAQDAQFEAVIEGCAPSYKRDHGSMIDFGR